MKSLRLSFMLLSGLSLGLLFDSAGLAAQKPFQPGAVAPKYRTHFVIYDVQKKTTTTLFTIEGEWHAPNWTPDGEYIVSDMGGDLYRAPVSGANSGKPEKINVGQKMIATNDHALSWDGKQIAITGITPPMPAQIRTPADIHNPILIMNMDGSTTHEVHLGWLHGWSRDGKYVVYTQYHGDNFDIYRINSDGSGELLMTTNKGQDDGPEYYRRLVGGFEEVCLDRVRDDSGTGEVNPPPWECKLVVTGNKITGTCKAQDKDHQVTGTVDGNKVGWQYEWEYGGSQLTVIYTQPWMTRARLREPSKCCRLALQAPSPKRQIVKQACISKLLPRSARPYVPSTSTWYR